ncbi:MAG: amino acid adenylation domain-containing protein [Candidatus Acidiferrum sp.]
MNSYEHMNQCFKRGGFSEQKLALLAKILDEEESRFHTGEGITRRESSNEYPLSSGQARLWFLNLLEGGDHYNENLSLRIKGLVDVPVLKSVLEEILRRHEVMRSIFLLEDGQPLQRVLPVSPINLPIVDLQDFPEPLAKADRLVLEEVRKPFDLSKGPLWRFSLLRLAQEDYVLLIVAHHITMDGWSQGIFLKEFGLLYEAFRAGRPSPLAPSAIQYADYAAWQMAWLQGTAAAQQHAYWIRQLADAPPPLELPADRPRPLIQTYEGAQYSFALPQPLIKELTELSRREGVTFFMAMLAAFQVLIGRYTQRTDIWVGTPIANRTHEEIEELIGFFVNTLVLRGDLSGDPSFLDLLQRIRRMTLDAFANRELPFEKVVNALSPERDRAHSPLIQVLFALQSTPRPAVELSELSLSSFEIESHTSKFDLSLVVREKPEVLCAFEYNTRLFNVDRIERMGGHLQVLLENIVREPNRRLSQMPILTAGESQQLLHEWNDMQMDFPADKCIQELFEEQVVRTPNADAVTFNGTSLSYDELNRQVNRLARYLRGLGVVPDTRVAICAERGFQMIVALLAVLKAGGSYVPLDPAYPVDRLNYMLEDSASALLLTQGELTRMFKRSNQRLPVIDLKNDFPKWEQQPDNNPGRGGAALTPANLAYVIYTSGSTGKPKGVMVEHRALAQHCWLMRTRYGLTPNDRVLQFASFSFDASIEQMFCTWLAGAGLILLSTGRLAPEHLWLEVRRHRVSVANFPPAYWQLLLDFMEGCHTEELMPLRAVILGGDSLTTHLAKQTRKALPRTLLFNAYGPTEAVITSTLFEVPDGYTADTATVPIGRPVANTRVYILDSHGQPVPAGVPGELYIGGGRLARGYLSQPDLTSDRFVPNLFSADPTARMYRTGDLARYLPDGNIEYLGRTDHQVKIRGFRIELGEIEATLMGHAGIREATVVAREYSDGNKQLVAYIVPFESTTVHSISDLRNLLTAKLPEHMIPSAFVVLENLPMTPSGKLDRKALPAPEADAYVVRRYEPPEGQIETVLAQIWTDLLKLERVGRHDNFFELGGHSLLAVTLLERMRRAGFRLDLQALFATPTLAQVAASAGLRTNTVEVPPNRIPNTGEQNDRSQKRIQLTI